MSHLLGRVALVAVALFLFAVLLVLALGAVAVVEVMALSAVAVLAVLVVLVVDGGEDLVVVVLLHPLLALPLRVRQQL